MTLEGLIRSLYTDTAVSLAGFRPELVLCATIVLILLLRIVRLTAWIDSFYIALVGSIVGLWFAAPWQTLAQRDDTSGHVTTAATSYYSDGPQQGRPPDGTLPRGTHVDLVRESGSYSLVRLRNGSSAYIAADAIRRAQTAPRPHGATRHALFTGMLIYDSFTVFIRVVLLLFAVLFLIFTRISGVPDRDAGPDVYPLVLGATLGMCLMGSANHLMMVFLGVEMASVPSYALAGLLKGRRQSSEAALKYAVYGAGTAGIMLYGISLLAGVLGSVHMPTMAVRLAELLRSTPVGEATGTHMVLALGALMLMVGLAFKLSAVPFHFWCPDVFEGASAEVAAFLSVASKAAALALLVRVALGLSYLPSAPDTQHTAMFAVASAESAADQGAKPAPVSLVAQKSSGARTTAASDGIPTDNASLVKSLAPVRNFIVKLLIFIAAITCTFGNLAAYGQTNIKRLLAYSTIAHAGYMIMPIAAAVALAGSNALLAEQALGALAIYIAIYLFMNLGAFAVVAFFRNELRSENIDDYAGLIREAPILVICFGLMLFSLLGLPPLAGFVAKFVMFLSLVHAQLWVLLVIACLNTALSLFYYLRVIKVMVMDPEPANRTAVNIGFVPATFVVLLTVPVLVLGLWWNDLGALAHMAASNLLS